MAITFKRVLITAGILAAKHTAAQTVECPRGWYETNGRCFRVFDFGENEKQSWESAMGICAAHGTPLATIHAAEEENIIASLSARYKGECWTGLRKYKRYKPEKGWLWIDRDESLIDDDYLNWGNEWQSVWKILPPDEKCGTIKQDGWGNRPCWGPGSKLQCFVCGTLDPQASEHAKQAFQNDFSTENWWLPPPSTNADYNTNLGSSEDGWNIEALDVGDSVAIDDPSTFWESSSGNGSGSGIDPSLLPATPTTTSTPVPVETTTTTLTPLTYTRKTTTTTTTTPIPTTIRRTTTTTTQQNVYTTTTTTTTPTPTTKLIIKYTSTPHPTTTRITTTTTLSTSSTTSITTPTPTPTPTTTSTSTTMPTSNTETTINNENKEFLFTVNSSEDQTADVEDREVSIITGLAIAVGSVAAAVATGAGVVAYKRHRGRQLSTSIDSSPETQSFTDIER